MRDAELHCKVNFRNPEPDSGYGKKLSCCDDIQLVRLHFIKRILEKVFLLQVYFFPCGIPKKPLPLNPLAGDRGLPPMEA